MVEGAERTPISCAPFPGGVSLTAPVPVVLLAYRCRTHNQLSRQISIIPVHSRPAPTQTGVEGAHNGRVTAAGPSPFACNLPGSCMHHLHCTTRPASQQAGAPPVAWRQHAGKACGVQQPAVWVCGACLFHDHWQPCLVLNHVFGLEGQQLGVPACTGTARMSESCAQTLRKPGLAREKFAGAHAGHGREGAG